MQSLTAMLTLASEELNNNWYTEWDARIGKQKKYIYMKYRKSVIKFKTETSNLAQGMMCWIYRTSTNIDGLSTIHNGILKGKTGTKDTRKNIYAQFISIGIYSLCSRSQNLTSGPLITASFWQPLAYLGTITIFQFVCKNREFNHLTSNATQETR